ncbi:Storkhead box 1 [Homalodisca vitripennis]|nr:Storkhead box 1 [Homalodisca vitripennis]
MKAPFGSGLAVAVIEEPVGWSYRKPYWFIMVGSEVVKLIGNSKDKVLYARSPAKRAQLERRHSLRLFGSNKRLSALQRSGSMRHIPSRQTSTDTSLVGNSLASSSTFSRKSLSLLSRIFRRSKRGKSQPLQTFSAQFPPTEWFNSRVRHLHSVGTQTQAVRTSTNRSNSPASSVRSRANSSSRTHLMERSWERERDGEGTLSRHHRRQGSATTTPTPSRPPSRRSSPHPAPAPSISPSRSSLSSSKTVVNTKSLSSASSGYNSLPRSTKSPKTSRQSSATPTPKNSPVHSATNAGKSSITLQVSTNQNKGNYSSQCDTNIGGFISSLKSSVGEVPDDNSTTMTTTINGANTTKIFVQQQNSPVRSIITFENGLGKNSQNRDLIILNGGKPVDTNKTNDKDGNNKKNRPKLERPTSLYTKEETEDTKSNEKLFGQLETQLKMKFPSSETIQLEEKLLTSTKNNKNSQKRPVFDSTKLGTGSLIDVANFESELNNVRKASISSTPLQSYNKTENLSVKNLLKESEHPFLPLIMNKEAKNFNSNPPSPTKPYPGEMSSDLVKLNGGLSTQDVGGKKEGNNELGAFPSLSDLSLHFTSIAAQNILKGVSINSIDTLVEVNMAAEKQNNCDVTVHTDFGVV